MEDDAIMPQIVSAYTIDTSKQNRITKQIIQSKPRSLQATFHKAVPSVLYKMISVT